jgi:hypothetical protein
MDDLALDKSTMTQLEKIKRLQNNSAVDNGGGVLKKKSNTGTVYYFLASPVPKAGNRCFDWHGVEQTCLYNRSFKNRFEIYRRNRKNLEQLLSRAEGKDGYYFLMKQMPYWENAPV